MLLAPSRAQVVSRLHSRARCRVLDLSTLAFSRSLSLTLTLLHACLLAAPVTFRSCID